VACRNRFRFHYRRTYELFLAIRIPTASPYTSLGVVLAPLFLIIDFFASLAFFAVKLFRSSASLASFAVKLFGFFELKR
jgi:hypothetical protein